MKKTDTAKKAPAKAAAPAKPAVAAKKAPAKPAAAPTQKPAAKPAAPKATDKVLNWQDGDRVRHAIFGEGVIEGVEGKGASQIIRVRFKNGVEKRLTALYAPLTRLEY